MKKKYLPAFRFKSKGFIIVSLLFAFNFSFYQTFTHATKWVAPKEADNLKNPLVGNSSVLGDAKKLYTSYCAPCHGEKGKGDGPAAAALNPKPADHSSA